MVAVGAVSGTELAGTSTTAGAGALLEDELVLELEVKMEQDRTAAAGGSATTAVMVPLSTTSAGRQAGSTESAGLPTTTAFRALRPKPP